MSVRTKMGKSVFFMTLSREDVKDLRETLEHAKMMIELLGSSAGQKRTARHAAKKIQKTLDWLDVETNPFTQREAK
jgi:hypothetical protein